MDKKPVVTYQSPRGDTWNLCADCQREAVERDAWPRDATGQEYCTVSHGLHDGRCDGCQRAE